MAVICLGGIGKQMKNYNKKSKKKRKELIDITVAMV